MSRNDASMYALVALRAPKGELMDAAASGFHKLYIPYLPGARRNQKKIATGGAHTHRAPRNTRTTDRREQRPKPLEKIRGPK